MLIDRGDTRGVFRVAGTDNADVTAYTIPVRSIYVDEISDSGTSTTGSFVRPATLQVESFAGETNTVTVAHVIIRDVSGGSVEFDMSATQFLDWYKRITRLPDWTDLCTELMRMDPNIRFNVYPNCWHGEYALNRAFYRCSIGTFLCEYVAHSEPDVKINEDEWKNVVFGTRSAL